jgi:hypothetical protein
MAFSLSFSQALSHQGGPCAPSDLSLWEVARAARPFPLPAPPTYGAVGAGSLGSYGRGGAHDDIALILRLGEFVRTVSIVAGRMTVTREKVDSDCDRAFSAYCSWIASP